MQTTEMEKELVRVLKDEYVRKDSVMSVIDYIFEGTKWMNECEKLEAIEGLIEDIREGVNKL